VCRACFALSSESLLSIAYICGSLITGVPLVIQSAEIIPVEPVRVMPERDTASGLHQVSPQIVNCYEVESYHSTVKSIH